MCYYNLFSQITAPLLLYFMKRIPRLCVITIFRIFLGTATDLNYKRKVRENVKFVFSFIVV